VRRYISAGLVVGILAVAAVAGGGGGHVVHRADGHRLATGAKGRPPPALSSTTTTAAAAAVSDAVLARLRAGDVTPAQLQQAPQTASTHHAKRHH
jgi:hypothetical protein